MTSCILARVQRTGEATMQEVLQRLEAIEAAMRTPPREFLGTRDAAEFLGLSRQQLDLWRMNGGGGPAFHRVGRRVLYSIQDLRDFMADRRQEPLS